MNPALSVSDLKKIRLSFKHWQHSKAHRPAPTPAMQLGTMVHTLTLEPQNNNYVIAPDINKRTKAGKEEWAAFQKENESNIITDQATMDQAQAMAESVHSSFPDLLVGEIEKSFFWDHIDGVRCKCRPDVFDFSKNRIVDLKTTSSIPTEAEFSKAVANFYYDMQAYHYSSGTGLATGGHIDEFLFLVVEKNAPYSCAVFKLDKDALLIGQALCEQAITKYVDVTRFGGEACLPKTIQTISLPAWANDIERR